eukprot:ctg_1990.g421
MDGRLLDGPWWLPSTRVRLALRGRFGHRCTDGALDGASSSRDASGVREMLVLVRDSDVTFAETVNGTVVARFAANALPGMDSMAEVRVIGATVAAGTLRDALLLLVSSTWMAWDGRREPQPMRLYEMWLDETGAADAQAMKQDAGARASLERAHWPAVADGHGGIMSQTTQVTAIPEDERRGRSPSSPSASAPSTRPLHTFVYVCTTAAPVAVCLRAHAASAPFHFRLLGASRVAEPPQNSCPRLLRDVSKQLPHWVGCIQCPCSFCAQHTTVTNALVHCLLLYDNLAYRIRWRLQPHATGEGDDDEPLHFWDAVVLHDVHSPDTLSSFSDIATNAVNRWERRCRHRLPFRDMGDAPVRKHSLVLLGVQLPCLNREVLRSDGTAPRAAARRARRPPWTRSAEPDDFVWNLDLADVRRVAPSTAAATEPPRVCCLDAHHRVAFYVLQPGMTSPVYRRTNPPQRLTGLHPAEDALAFVTDDAVVTSFGRRVPFSPPNTASEMTSLVPGADVFTRHAVMMPSEHTDGKHAPDNTATGDALLVTVAERPAASPAVNAHYMLRSTTVGMALRPCHFQHPLPGAPARVFRLGVGAVSRLLVAYDMPEQRTVVLRLEVHDGSSIRCAEDTDADHALETADTTLAVVHLPHSAMAVQVCARSWRVVRASADRHLECRQQVVVPEAHQRLDCLAVHDERLLAYTVGHRLYVYQRAAPGAQSDDTDEVFVPCAAISLRSTSSCLLLTAECIRVWSWDAVHSQRIPYRWDVDGRFRGIQDHNADGGGATEAPFSYRQVVRAALSLARTGTELLFLEDGAVVVNGQRPERLGGVMATFETVSEAFHGTVPTSSLFAAGAGCVRLSAAADSARTNAADLDMCLVVAGGNVWAWMECADGSSSSRGPSPVQRRLAPVWVGDPQRRPVRSLTWMPLSHGAEAATLAFVWLHADNMLCGGVLDTSLAARRAERPLSVGEPDRLCYEPITGWVLVLADGGVQAFDPLRLESRGSILSIPDAASSSSSSSSSPRIVDVAVPPRAHAVTKQAAPAGGVILALSDEGFAWYRTVRRGEPPSDTSWQRLPRTPCPIEGQQRQRAVSPDEVGEPLRFGRSLVDDCVLLIRATCGGYCFEAWHCPLAACAQDVAAAGPRCLAHSCRPDTLMYAFDPESRPITLLAVTEGRACVVYGAASGDLLRPPFRPGQNVELWCNNACDATQWLASADRHLLVQRGAQAEVLAVDVDGSLSPAGSIRAWPMFRHLLSYSFRASWPMRRVGEEEHGGVSGRHAAAFSDNAWCYLHQT